MCVTFLCKCSIILYTVVNIHDLSKRYSRHYLYKRKSYTSKKHLYLLLYYGIPSAALVTLASRVTPSSYIPPPRSTPEVKGHETMSGATGHTHTNAPATSILPHVIRPVVQGITRALGWSEHDQQVIVRVSGLRSMLNCSLAGRQLVVWDGWLCWKREARRPACCAGYMCLPVCFLVCLSFPVFPHASLKGNNPEKPWSPYCLGRNFCDFHI